MAGYSSDTDLTTTRGGVAQSATNGGVQKPALEKTKAVSYSATQSDQIFSMSTDATATSTMGVPSRVVLENTGNTPIFSMVGYQTYSADSTDGDVEYLHSLILPGDTLNLPIRSVINTNASNTLIMDGASMATNKKVSSINSGLLWKDSTANLKAHVRPAATDPITITVDTNETNFFRVGDLIQIGRGTSQTDITEANYHREILRVQSITDGENMVCERALHGTTAGDYDETNWNAGHGIDQPIYLPFFNAYHDTDKYSVAQTDHDGKFKCNNFFGEGRTSSASFGVNPGSFCLKFYESGYQELGLSGILPSTESGLTASQQYKIDLTVNGGTLFQDLSFTVDATNTKFGGATGIIQKIQDALDAQFYTAGNLFETGVTVGIVNGDIRFTSNSRLSTSAILLADTGDAYSLFDAAAVGRIPSIDNIKSPVAAKLPDDVLYDKVTYSTSPNNVFAYDDGKGNIMGLNGITGTINYETGAIDIQNAPPFAEFVYCGMFNTAFSGKLNPLTADRENTIQDIYVNSPSQKQSGQVNLKVY